MNIPEWKANPEDSIDNLRCLNQNNNQDFNLQDLFKKKNAVIYQEKKDYANSVFLWDYYKYKGSLTKPPCTENVLWFVLENKISIGQTQLDNLKKYGLNKFSINPDNIRTVQPLNTREIEYYQAEVCNSKSEEKKDPVGSYNYIKASKAYTIYGLADKNSNISDIFQNYSMKGNSKKISIGDDEKKPDIVLDFATAEENSKSTPPFIPDDSMRKLIEKYNNVKMGSGFDNNDAMKKLGASYG